MEKEFELCARLLTSKIDSLTEEEREDLFIELDDPDFDENESSHMICKRLLSRIAGKQPVGPFAHKYLSDLDKKRLETKRRFHKQDQAQKRKNLTGCQLKSADIFGFTKYHPLIDYELASGMISVHSSLYEKLLSEYKTPIIEMQNEKEERIYLRVSNFHDEDKNVIFISPAVLERFQWIDYVLLMVCKNIPEISFISFLFLGSQEDLNDIMDILRNDLPGKLNKLTGISLGEDLKMVMENKEEFIIRIIGLKDLENEDIFAGRVSLGEQDVPFDIIAE